MQFLTTKLPAYLPLVLLSVALLVGLIMVRRVWEETHEDVEPVSEHELLDEFEKAHAAGELDEVELRRVRALLHRPRHAESAPTDRERIGPEPEPPAEAASPPGDDGEVPPASAS